MQENKHNLNPDVVLIGAGIMSATLGVMLKELQPGLTIQIFERLDTVADESSDAWNNAGTGHSAFCELNYTPEKEDGSIDISKAIGIASSFEVSKQFWTFLVGKGYVGSPETFINSIPHMSFVWGDENVNYLRKRHDALVEHPLFSEMQYSEDEKQLAEWIPLVMKDRDPAQKVAATKMDLGTDVNFGVLTRALFAHLEKMDGVDIYLNHEVEDLKCNKFGKWEIDITDITTKRSRHIQTGFVFIGAGGGALPLLEKSDVEEGKGFGGFPVSGQWLRCTNDEVIKQHAAKVYGKASVGAPPMSVPHLDTRMIEGKKALLFGPYAGFSTKFLKKGSLLDLPKSIQLNNIRPMLSAGLHNIPLTKYLIDQVRQSPEDRLKALQEYFPDARMEDWELAIAGQRVQVIKKDKKEGGVLEFGTEMVSTADGSLAALLGASPGASTSVSIMLELIQKCFKDEIATDAWQKKMKEMIPTYGAQLGKDAALSKKTRAATHKALHLVMPKES